MRSPRPRLETDLVGFGTVFERAWVVDVVHQTHHVTGEVGLGQEVKVCHHLVELVCRERRRGGRCRGHHVGPKLVFYRDAAVGPYQQVLLLTVNVRRVDGV